LQVGTCPINDRQIAIIMTVATALIVALGVVYVAAAIRSNAKVFRWMRRRREINRDPK